jgi:hypothetical protein
MICPVCLFPYDPNNPLEELEHQSGMPLELGKCECGAYLEFFTDSNGITTPRFIGI